MQLICFLKKLCLPLFCIFFAVTPSFAAGKADENVLTVGTGGITGVYYPVGGAICYLINKHSKSTGFRSTAESTGASVFNANALRKKHIDLAIIQSDIQYYAYTGTMHFTLEGPDKSLRALFSLHTEPFTVVARTDAGIANFRDLLGKRLNIGDVGSGNRSTLELLLKEYSWNVANFIASDFPPIKMVSALCDNHIDAYVYVIGHPNASVKEAVNSCNAVIVPVEGPEVEALMDKYAFYSETIVPGDLYHGVHAPVKTFGPRATLVTTEAMPEETAYQIVKAVLGNMEEFKRLHPSLAALTLKEMLTGNSAPFHPGALRYFKEVGLL